MASKELENVIDESDSSSEESENGSPKKVVHVEPVSRRPQTEKISNIIDKRDKDGGIQYLVKYEDRSNSENCWVPVQFLDCHDLIAEFEKEWEKEFAKVMGKGPYKPLKPRHKKHKLMYK